MNHADQAAQRLAQRLAAHPTPDFADPSHWADVQTLLDERETLRRDLRTALAEAAEGERQAAIALGEQDG
jgi:hypothetical protein